MRAKFIYETFSEEGDPIRDMGIGSPFYKLKRGDVIIFKGDEKKKLGDDMIVPGAKGIVSHISIFNSNIEITAIFFSNVTSSKIRSVLEDIGAWEISTITLTVRKWEENFEVVKYEDVNDIDNIPVNEKFSQDESDPIRDMGIGNPFYKLKRGDVIVLKEGGKGPKGKGLIIDIFISSTIITIKAAFFYTISISEINLVLKNDSNYNITTLTFTVSEWVENFRIIKYEDVDNIPMNEKFSQDESDPIQDMEIGQIHIYKKLIETWFNTLYDTKYIKHKKYVINSDLTIDILEDLDISYSSMKNLPYYIRFNRIHGDFACSFDENEFLDYIPKQVDGELRFYVKGVEDKKYNIIKQKIKQVCIVEEVEVKEAY